MNDKVLNISKEHHDFIVKNIGEINVKNICQFLIYYVDQQDIINSNLKNEIETLKNEIDNLKIKLNRVKKQEKTETEDK